jgi:hypothetical protein
VSGGWRSKAASDQTVGLCLRSPEAIGIKRSSLAVVTVTCSWPVPRSNKGLLAISLLGQLLCLSSEQNASHPYPAIFVIVARILVPLNPHDFVRRCTTDSKHKRHRQHY